jgi:glycogen operon protein
MADENWQDPVARCIGLRLAGDAIDEVDAQGDPVTDDTLLILLNAHHEPLSFTLPAHRPGVKWELALDTRTADGRRLHRPMKGGEVYNLEARCVALLQLRRKA